jgi:hypothetical protein
LEADEGTRTLDLLHGKRPARMDTSGPRADSYAESGRVERPMTAPSRHQRTLIPA